MYVVGSDASITATCDAYVLGMGPLVILDKSALQSLGPSACRELQRHFFTVVAPVMLLEVLGNLKHEKHTIEENQRRVKMLIDKVPRLNMAVAPSYQTLCVQEVYGLRIGQPRGNARQVPAWANTVETSGGKVAIRTSPEREAMSRWEAGAISEGEELLAGDWRRVTKSLDLESFRRRFRGLSKTFKTIEDVDVAVRQLLAEEGTQLAVLEALLGTWPEGPAIVRKLQTQWRLVTGMQPGRHWWYNLHCGRVLLTLLTGVSAGVIGTRSTNRVDAEYFNYTPFAHIFVSGDHNTHGQMSRVLLDPEQSFVDAARFGDALRELANRRAAAKTAGSDRQVSAIEPAPGSLVHNLHVKHLGQYHPRRPTTPTTLPSHITPQYLRGILREAEDAIKSEPGRYLKPPSWPTL